MSIYQDIILDHYRNPRNSGTIKNATSHIKVNNPLCGDMLEMDIEEKDGTISNIMFSGQGCAISQAAASMVTEYAKGKSKEELKKLDKDFMIELLGIQLSPNRLKCALLSLEALQKLTQ